jgi:hypothetical protein
VGVGLSGEGGRQRWCGFNALVSAWDGRRRDEALPKDEVEVASSSWLYGKEAQRHWLEERHHQGGKLRRLDRKMKKIYAVDSVWVQMDGEDLKQW